MRGPARLLFLGAVACAVAASTVWPAPARAQPAGFYAYPSLALSGVFDDNVFATASGREADFILRLTPGIRIGYRSAPLTILGDYAFDAEKYAVNDDLDNVADRQRLALELRYRPDRRLSFGLAAAFTRTNRPIELSQQKGLQPITREERGFEEATAFTVSPSVKYDFTALWSGTARYTFSLLDAAGGIATTTHEAALGMIRLFTPRDTGSAQYVVRHFDEDTGRTETSHILLLVWTHRFSERTTLALQAGPRFTEGDIGSEVLASLQHKLKHADLSLTYARTQAVTVGQSGTSDTDTLSAQVSFRPLRFLTVSLGPSFQRSSPETGSGGSSETTTYYSFGAGATYQIKRWLSARAAYQWSLQDSGSRQILHNLLSIGLVAEYPIRLD